MAISSLQQYRNEKCAKVQRVTKISKMVNVGGRYLPISTRVT